MTNPRRLMLAALLAAFLTGCAETETKSTADKQATTEATDASDQEAAAEDEVTKEQVEPEEVASMGDSITLTGNEEDLSIKVRFVKLRKNIPGDQFDTIEGKRIGVELLLTNTGTATYSDAPSNGAKIISKSDREFDPAFVTSGSCELPVNVKIAPGAKRRVCIPFDVPKSVKPKMFQFTLDSGFGPESGEWQIGS
jgi:hypothetical protein